MQRAVCVINAMVATLFAVAMLSCEDIKVEKNSSEAYLTTTDVVGKSTNCAVVLKAQQGTSYSINISSEQNWATFSNGARELSDVMTTTDKVVYIYFSKNPSGVSRTADVNVSFSDSISYSLSFTQHSYDEDVAFERRWAELPVCKTDDRYIYNTHYGAMGVRESVRNYTYCFDSENHASVWVAYPLHSSYTTGSANRNNSDFHYDPEVSISDQANVASGSYSGRYDRGHQIPAADRKCSQEMMNQTFYATNMTPQYYSFNQNVWASLEGKVRNQICADTLYVVTGAWFEGDHDSSIASSASDRSGKECPTPTYYFKALLRTQSGRTGLAISDVRDASQLRAIALWMKHSDTGEDTAIAKTDCITIDELESKIGFDLFPMIDDSIEQTVEQTIDTSSWGLSLK